MKTVILSVITSVLLSFIITRSVQATSSCLQEDDYYCFGQGQVQYNIERRLQNAFPLAPLACYEILIDPSEVECSQCEAFTKYAPKVSCERIVNRVNKIKAPGRIPIEIRCAFRLRINLIPSCQQIFNQLYHQFPHVDLPVAGKWVPIN